MVILTCILLLITILKLSAILNAIRWLITQGKIYRDNFLKTSHEFPSPDYQTLEQYKADFFPFGRKDFKLHKYIETNSHNIGRQKIPTFLARRFQWIFRFNILTLLTTGYLLIASDLVGFNWFDWFLSEEIHLYMVLALAVIMLVANICLSVETIYSYAILGSYAVSFHLLSPEKIKLSGGTILLLELKVFAQRVISAICASSIACYVVHLKFKGLTGNICAPTSFEFLNRICIFVQCIYFTVTTFTTVGYGDIQPNAGVGQLIAFLIMVQSFSLVIIVFATLLSSRQVES